jgi:AcrR family transcriptional regulator
MEKQRSKETEIRAVAARLFREKGYHATSMGEIARAVGIQKASLYYYVSGKEELLLLASREAIAALNEAVTKIVDSDLSAAEKLRQAFATHIRVLCENMDSMSVFLREMRALPTTHRETILEEGRKYERMVQQILREGMHSGEFRDVDVVMASYAVLGAINWLHQWYRADGRLSPDQIADVFVDLVFRGLLQ